MGNIFQSSRIYCNFEDIQAHMNDNNFIIINTLSQNDQDILIKNTIQCEDEAELINIMIKTNKSNRKNIIVYGKNWRDETIYTKSNQLTSLGFTTYLYVGGLFEWICLQDIYGMSEFPTTQFELDILKYKPSSGI